MNTMIRHREKEYNQHQFQVKHFNYLTDCKNNVNFFGKNEKNSHTKLNFTYRITTLPLAWSKNCKSSYQ